MNILKIKVNEQVRFLTEWRDFDNCLPHGACIVDKGICGCGASEYYLCSGFPVLLLSPRKELIESKMKPQRQNALFYFDRSQNGKNGEKLVDTIGKLKSYLSDPSTHVSKSLVTYDSAGVVIDKLTEWGLLQRFTIVVDEFSCIFTDAKLKGFVELNLIYKLRGIRGVDIRLISATPIPTKFLDVSRMFSGIQYVKLVWSAGCYEHVRFTVEYMKSPQHAIRGIIANFRHRGWFNIIPHTGQKSIEAVFFLNSVRDIIGIINECKLTPADTIVVCADDKSNREKLKSVGFEIGHVPGENEQRKTFMFCTKASFEGVDFYSACSTTYIFGDPNVDCLCLDISIDLPQIIGRCRTKSNPFRNMPFYYCKTSGVPEEDVLIDKIRERFSKTVRLLKDYGGISSMEALEKLIVAQKSEQYCNDYLDVLKTGKDTGSVMINELVYFADIRAFDLVFGFYDTMRSVKSQCSQNPYWQIVPPRQTDPVSQFITEYHMDGDFSRRMELVKRTTDTLPELKECIYGLLGADSRMAIYNDCLDAQQMKAVGYRQCELEKRYTKVIQKGAVSFSLKSKIQKDTFYSNKDIKDIIKEVYDELGISLSAKATDITEYLDNVKETSSMINGKKTKGYIYMNEIVTFYKNVFGMYWPGTEGKNYTGM